MVIVVAGGLAVFFTLRTTAPRPTPATTLVPTPPPAPTPVAPTPPPVPEPPRPAALDADRDGDGISDAGEALFGIDPERPDSDADGYADLLEIQNLYNPAGIAPQRLLDAGLVYRYEHPHDGWSILLPRSWSIAATDESQQQLVIRTEFPGEEIVLSLRENARRLPLREWVTTAMSGTEAGGVAGAVTDVHTKSGSGGIRGSGTPAGYPVAWFVVLPDRVLAIEYHATTLQIRYAAVFDMIVQSLVFPGSTRGNITPGR